MKGFKKRQNNEILILDDNSTLVDDSDYDIATQSEIDNYLFNRKKEELLQYCKTQKELKKKEPQIFENNQTVNIVGTIDQIIDLFDNVIKEDVFPCDLYDDTMMTTIRVVNANKAQTYLNTFIMARRNNYNINLKKNADLINACNTLAELERLNLIFEDLIINL